MCTPTHDIRRISHAPPLFTRSTASTPSIVALSTLVVRSHIDRQSCIERCAANHTPQHTFSPESASSILLAWGSLIPIDISYNVAL